MSILPAAAPLTALLRAAEVPHTEPVPELEGAAYAAARLLVAGRPCRFRRARTTPTKAGHFVTVWQRSAAGPIRPLDPADGVDTVFVWLPEDAGVFLFPASVLVHHGVMSRKFHGGKRGFRVYAPSLEGLNAQASRSQAWQGEYFLSLPAAPERLRTLLDR